MNIVQLYDVNAIRSIMLHEDIFSDIIDDTYNGVSYVPDVEKEIFLGVILDNTLIGVYRLHWVTGVTLEGHAHILKKYRKEYSKKSAFLAMSWILKNIKLCEKIDAYVPKCSSNIINFLTLCGFLREGISMKSYKKNNILHDRILLGITRARMQEVIENV